MCFLLKKNIFAHTDQNIKPLSSGATPRVFSRFWKRHEYPFNFVDVELFEEVILQAEIKLFSHTSRSQINRSVPDFNFFKTHSQ